MTRLRPPQLVGLAAAIGLAVAGMLKWLDGDPGITGYNVPVKFLTDVEVVQEGVSIGAVLLLVAVVGAVGVFAPQLRFLTVLAGAAAVFVVVLFEYRLGDFADLVRNDPFASDDLSRSNLTGFGVWVAGIAGLVLAAGGLLIRPVRSH